MSLYPTKSQDRKGLTGKILRVSCTLHIPEHPDVDMDYCHFIVYCYHYLLSFISPSH